MIFNALISIFGLNSSTFTISKLSDSTARYNGVTS